MFRQWLSDWVCRNYGHHWWVTFGTKTNEVGNEDGTTEIRVYVTSEYGNCKRCGTAPNDPDFRAVHTLTIKQPVLESFAYDGENCTTKLTQKIEQAP